MDVVMIAIYLLQIGALLCDIYMTFRARHALNGMGNVLLVVYVLLIVRRIDDVNRNADSLFILLLSSAVVAFVTWNTVQVYRAREVYALYLIKRKQRIAELEALRAKDEVTHSWSEGHKVP